MLPNALEAFDQWYKAKGMAEIALFLDFDGTVTPIVARPEWAVMNDKVRLLIKELAGLCKVAFVTGRDLDDIIERVAIGKVSFAGSHGFSVQMDDGYRIEFGQAYLDALGHAAEALCRDLEPLPGLQIERKRFAIAIHTRGASEPTAQQATELVARFLDGHSELVLGHGKKVLEIRPAMDWHKGRAVRWMMQRWQRNSPRMVPIMIGDDITDEDAFDEISTDGMAILVGDHGRTTKAAFGLPGVQDVEMFLGHVRSIIAMEK